MPKQETAASLRRRLMGYLHMRDHDPHANPAKLLAFHLSDKIVTGELSLNRLEAILCDLCKSTAQERGQRLARRAGVPQLGRQRKQFAQLVAQQANNGFRKFKKWAETEAIGLVVTAHPTFALTEKMRTHVLAAATGKPSNRRLKAGDIIRSAAPDLHEEHRQAQATICVMHRMIDAANEVILHQAAKSFPLEWTKITPHPVSVASWVGYDLDGRRDIEWTDTIRLKLSEKAAKLEDYHQMAATLAADFADIPKGLSMFLTAVQKAAALALREQRAFEENMGNKPRLVAAANFLTVPQADRWLDDGPAIKYLNTAIKQTKNSDLQKRLVLLRAHIKRCGMGTAALHLRVNAQQVLHAIDTHLSMTENERLNSRTFLRRVGNFAKKVKPVETNIANLDSETGTVNRQLIMAAQILKNIDRKMPIRFLIAECDQASTVIAALALARYYGVANHLDISPLFETPDALRNGGRVVAQMLQQATYREHLQNRGVIAIQTGFSDAGRFMGQVAAVLAIERLQSHFAAAIADSGLSHLRAVIFNTHGESAGRGGHPGTLKQRMDYIMSPWVFERFRRNHIAVTHEFSFQGGDGFLWFANETLGEAALLHLLSSRFQSAQSTNEDEFYADADFVWDFYNEIISQQDSLYNDDDYRYILSGFARNFLVPSGSRPEIRQASGPLMQSTFTPRRIRAIPHNAILQQLSIPTNVIFGLGRAARIDPNRLSTIFSKSPRGRTILDLVEGSWRNTHLQILAAYGDFHDPNFWISRSLTHPHPTARWQFRVVANELYKRNANAKIRPLLYRLRADGALQTQFMPQRGQAGRLSLSAEADKATQTQIVLHCIRLALLMHAQFTCAALPVNAPPGATRDEMMEKMCNYDLAEVIKTLERNYPSGATAHSWSDTLIEKGSKVKTAQTVSEQTLANLKQCARLVQLTNQGLVQAYDAYG